MDKDELYEKIKDIMTKERFEYEISERKRKYNNLLDDDAIALLIVDELGRMYPCSLEWGDWQLQFS
mgnify:CR=1 FL=1